MGVVMSSILFVCSANQCRSPMAEGLFKEILIKRGEESSWRVESAGVWAYEGASATHNAQLVMQERGIDISNHLSRKAQPSLVQTFDLVLVMEQAHKETLLEENPSQSDRFFLFSEMINSEADFEDPVGGSLDRYRQAADEIEHILTRGIGQIMNSVSN